MNFRRSQREVVIASAVRLPVGRLGGTLKDSDEATMGLTVIKEAAARAGITPGQVDELVMGHNFRSGMISSNSARVMAARAGIPLGVPQFTINKHCGAGLKAVVLASQAIQCGDAEVVAAGGIELMSAAAYLLPNMRWGSNRKFGHHVLQDQLVMQDPLCGMTMGETAEELSRRFGISREEQDEYAYLSWTRAEKAVKEGRFRDEIVPIEVPQQKGPPVLFDTDETPRFGTTLETLRQLRPVFREDGCVTAGNASQMSDGAAALVLMSGQRARELGVRPLGRIVGYASVGVDPAIMGVGPVYATRALLQKAGVSLHEIGLFEVNEAFACVNVYYQREIGPDLELVNVNGGAISLGHPIAATGAIILTKLVHEMNRRSVRLGLATMCIGGGQGIALLVANAAV